MGVPSMMVCRKRSWCLVLIIVSTIFVLTSSFFAHKLCLALRPVSHLIRRLTPHTLIPKLRLGMPPGGSASIVDGTSTCDFYPRAVATHTGKAEPCTPRYQAEPGSERKAEAGSERGGALRPVSLLIRRLIPHTLVPKLRLGMPPGGSASIVDGTSTCTFYSRAVATHTGKAEPCTPRYQAKPGSERGGRASPGVSPHTLSFPSSAWECPPGGSASMVDGTSTYEFYSRAVATHTGKAEPCTPRYQAEPGSERGGRASPGVSPHPPFHPTHSRSQAPLGNAPRRLCLHGGWHIGL